MSPEPHHPDRLLPRDEELIPPRTPESSFELSPLILSTAAKELLSKPPLTPLAEFLLASADKLTTMSDVRLSELESLISEREEVLNGEIVNTEEPEASAPSRISGKRGLKEWQAEWRAFKEIDSALGALLRDEIARRRVLAEAAAPKEDPAKTDFDSLVTAGVMGGDLAVLRLMCLHTPEVFHPHLLAKDCRVRQIAALDWNFPKQSSELRELFVESAQLERKCPTVGVLHLRTSLRAIEKQARESSEGKASSRVEALVGWARKVWAFLTEDRFHISTSKRQPHTTHEDRGLL